MLIGLVVAVLLLGFAYMGGPVALGAHPWWGFKVGYVGVPVGLVLYLTQLAWRAGYAPKAALYAVFLCLAAYLTYRGKIQFAASYAEDAAAGRMWFFGWIAVFVFGTLFVTHIFGRRRGK
ncbi:MAG: hypothetical protein ACSHXD_12330 [Marinosulfonomonas sp.]